MQLPSISVSQKTKQRICNNDCWVFQDEMRKVDPGIGPNGLVRVVDENGSFLAYAFYNSVSHIRLRILSTDISEYPDHNLISSRIETAIKKRLKIEGANAKRIIFSESDGLPGLIVDKYGQHIVMQIRSAGMERFKENIVNSLKEKIKPKGIIERSDKEFRKEEGLEPHSGLLYGECPERITIQENGLRFLVDPYKGLKTGFYLDQRNTRQKLMEWIKGAESVLDVCSYTGAIGISAASKGAKVTCIEQNEDFIRLARENALLNGVSEKINFVCADAFYFLEAKAGQKSKFDWIILDPPSLAKNKSELTKARSALHHLLINSMKLLKPEGQMILSICTYHLLGLTEEILRIAASKVGLRLQICEAWQQAEDHPWIIQMPYTRYLMSWRLKPFGLSKA